jgi:hypothetical protein
MPVYTLLVQTGRTAEDDLPEGSTGAALLCYAAGEDEPTAVRETVEVLRKAGFDPLDVQAYGTQEEQEADGTVFGEAELGLMARAAAENAVIVAKADPLYDTDFDDDDDDDDDFDDDDDCCLIPSIPSP